MKTATGTQLPNEYDWITDELISWVRNVPSERDAVANIPRIIEEYENRKTSWQRLKEILK